MAGDVCRLFKLTMFIPVLNENLEKQLLVAKLDKNKSHQLEKFYLILISH